MNGLGISIDTVLMAMRSAAGVVCLASRCADGLRFQIWVCRIVCAVLLGCWVSIRAACGFAHRRSLGVLRVMVETWDFRVEGMLRFCETWNADGIPWGHFYN